MADDTLALPDVLDGFGLNDIGSGIWTPRSSFLTDALRFPFNLAGGFPSAPNEVSDTSPRRTRKRRGKAYTGCLTCRTRKIKCDGIRPVCSNCQRSRHYVCHGYVEPSSEAPAGDISEQRSRPRKAPKTRGPVSSDHLPSSIHENRPRPPPSQPIHQSDYGQEPRDPVDGDTPDFNLDVDVDVDEDCISLSTETCNRLFAHYQNVVLVPMALQDPPNDMQLALRYALLAVSAIHASGVLKHPSGVNQEQAQRLQKKAKHLILAALDEQRPESVDSDTLGRCALLGAATILISADIFSGESRDSTSSINLAKHVFRKTGGDAFWKNNPEPSVLYQLLRCHDLIASTANIDSPESVTDSLMSSPVQHDANDPEINLSDDSREGALLPLAHYILDTSFGISMHTISLLGQVIHLSSECARSPWSSGIQATAQALQQRLHNFNENTITLIRSEYNFTTRSSSNATTTLHPALPSLPLVPTLPSAVRDELLHNHL